MTERHLQALLTSIFSPCIIVDTRRSVLLVSSFSSAIAHCIMLVTLTVEVSSTETPKYELAWAAWGLFVVSPLVFVILNWYGKEENRQLFGYWLDPGYYNCNHAPPECASCLEANEDLSDDEETDPSNLISLCCDGNRQLEWACQKGHVKVVKALTKHCTNIQLDD